MAAAVYYQAQFMLLANSAASTPTAAGGDGTSIGMDNSALSEYYKQFVGYVWNDRTPTSSDAEDAGTPLPSDKEDEKEEERTVKPFAGESQTSSDKSKKLETKGKGTSKGGERERRKVKRSRNHKHLSVEGTSATSTTKRSSVSETERTVQKKKTCCQESPNGQGMISGGMIRNNDSKVTDCEKVNDKHQSDSFTEKSANTITHPSTNEAMQVSEGYSRHSPQREKQSPKRHREDRERKEPNRMAKEPQRAMKETLRKSSIPKSHSSSRSLFHSPSSENMDNQHQSNGFVDKSTSSIDTKTHPSTNKTVPKREGHSLHSPKREKHSPNRHREDGEMKELHRETKHRETQGEISSREPQRESSIRRSHSSSRSVSHSPTGNRYQSNSSNSYSSAGVSSKAHLPANEASPSYHTLRIEKRSPQRYRGDRETNKLHREEPYRGPKEPHKEARNAHRETREAQRETMEAYRESREAHRETREANRMTREVFREMREACRETREAHRETRDAQRETREVHRETHWEVREPQAETKELQCHRDRRMAQRETKEAHRDRESRSGRRSHSSSQLSSCSRLRSRSPSHDKENISRPPSLSREERPRREPMDTRPSRSNTAEEESRRRLSRKRKHSSPPQSLSQHNRKLARGESYQRDITQAKTNRYDRHSTQGSCEVTPILSLVSPVSFSPNFDDITTPPTPNADEILPYSTDVQLCENSAVMLYDDAKTKGKLSDLSCSPIPTSELQIQDEEEKIMRTKALEMKPQDSENKSLASTDNEYNDKRSVKPKELLQEKSKSSAASGDHLLAKADNDTAVPGEGEPKVENIVSTVDEKEASDLEEGEITDSDSDSGEEDQPATRKEANKSDQQSRSIERREVKISESYRSQQAEKRSCDEQVSEEKRLRRVSCHGSGRHHQRHSSPRSSRHPPLSERRNRHSPPSLKKRTGLFDHDGHVIRKHYSNSERHTHHYFEHTRSNLPEELYY